MYSFTESKQNASDLTDLSHISHHLNKRNLAPDLFTQSYEIRLENSIADHARFAFTHIYGVPYRIKKNNRTYYSRPHKAHIAYGIDSTAKQKICYSNADEDKQNYIDSQLPNSRNAYIARPAYGIQHASRIAVYVQVLANLYHKYNKRFKCSEQDIKLLQITALFYNAARIHECDRSKDLNISALFLYAYLTQTLQIDKATAEAFANLINKPYSIDINKTHKQILGDALNFELIRLGNDFDGSRLFFCQFTKNTKKRAEEAQHELLHLITEIRSLMRFQGDLTTLVDFNQKKLFEGEKGLDELINVMENQNYKILSPLSTQLLPYKKLQQPLLAIIPYQKELGLGEANLNNAMYEGRLFARTLTTPAQLDYHGNHTRTALELEKVMRQGKTRPASMLGCGIPPVSNSGYLLIPPVKKIKLGNRKHYDKTTSSLLTISPVELTDLNYYNKLGSPNSRAFFCDLTYFSAIYYCNEHSEAPHPAALLRAIFLQQQYQKLYAATKKRYLEDNELGLGKFIKRFGAKEKLPIFEYFWTGNAMREISTTKLTDDQLLAMWVEVTSRYMEQSLTNGTCITDCTIAQIMSFSITGKRDPQVLEYYDIHYSSDLRKRINKEIAKEKTRLLQQLAQKIRSKEIAILSSNAFFNVILEPELLESVRDILITEMEAELTCSSLFKDCPPASRFFDLTPYSCFKSYLAFPTNENWQHALKSIFSDNTANHFFRTKVMKIYALAQVLHLSEPIRQIQEQAHTHALHNNIRGDFFITGIYQLLNFVAAFNSSATLEEFKLQLNKIIELQTKRLLSSFSIKYIYILRSELERFFDEVIAPLQANNLCNDERLAIIRRKFADARANITSSELKFSDGSQMYAYLCIMESIGDNPKQEIMHSLQQQTPFFYLSKFEDYQCIVKLAEMLPFNNHSDLVTLIIENTLLADPAQVITTKHERQIAAFKFLTKDHRQKRKAETMENPVSLAGSSLTLLGGNRSDDALGRARMRDEDESDDDHSEQRERKRRRITPC